MNIIKKFFRDNNSQNTQIQKNVENVQSVIDKTDEEKEIARKKATQVALTQLQKNSNMPVGEFLKMLQEKTSLTEDNLVTIITQLPEIRSEKATIAAVQSTSLPPEKITSIVKEADISLDTAEKIVKEIDDKDIQKEQQKRLADEREQQILKDLSDMYNNCDNMNSQILQDAINELREKNASFSTPEIEKKIMSIVARRAALDCMTFGDARIYPLTRIVSSLDMLENDLPSMVYNEYRTLKANFDEHNRKYKEFTSETKKTLHNSILEDIAKKSAKNFDNIGDFSIPDTEKFKNLSNEDMILFIKTVKSTSKDIDKSSIRRLTRQLQHGKSSEELLDKTISEIEISIKKLPKESQLSSAQTILEILNQRNEANLLMKNVRQTSSRPSTGDESR